MTPQPAIPTALKVAYCWWCRLDKLPQDIVTTKKNANPDAD